MINDEILKNFKLYGYDKVKVSSAPWLDLSKEFRYINLSELFLILYKFVFDSSIFITPKNFEIKEKEKKNKLEIYKVFLTAKFQLL